MLVQANEVDYDYNNSRVSAVGNVQLYYNGTTVEADKVIYDQKTKRLHAEGNIRMTDADGKITYANIMDLSDDYRDGFVDSLHVDTADQTRMAATRADRQERVPREVELHAAERLERGAGVIDVAARPGGGKAEPAVAVLLGGQPALRAGDRPRSPADAGAPQREDGEGGQVDLAGDRPVAADVPLQLSDEVTPADAAGRLAGSVEDEDRALEPAHVSGRPGAGAHVGHQPGAAVGDQVEVMSGRGEPQRRPSGEQGAGGLSGCWAEAAVRVLGGQEIRRRRVRDARHDQRCSSALHNRDPYRIRR